MASLIRTWSDGDQWYVPPSWAGRDSQMWDLRYFDEMDNGPWDVEICAEEMARLSKLEGWAIPVTT